MTVSWSVILTPLHNSTIPVFRIPHQYEWPAYRSTGDPVTWFWCWSLQSSCDSEPNRRCYDVVITPVTCLLTSRRLYRHCVAIYSEYLKPFDANCCHMGKAIKHPVPDGVKPSFVIFDIPALWRLRVERQSAWMSKIANDGLIRSGTGCTYDSCIHVATVGVKGLSVYSLQYWFDRVVVM